MARYQERVKLLKGNNGFIDLFWPNTLIIEHKSTGENLDSAYNQAGSYFDGLSEEERPQYIIVTDYQRMRFYDLEAEDGVQEVEFRLEDLPKNIRLFGFIAGFRLRQYKEEDPINVKTVRAIGRLYEAIKSSNYRPESIDVLLTRLVFILFADDTGIFNKDAIRSYLEDHTKMDGSDIGAHLGYIFETLDTPIEKRQTSLNEGLTALPYVNGGLFAEKLWALFSTEEIRVYIMSAMQFDWSRVSPAIFGSMFQSVLSDKARHDLGAHYTSEKNILKVISPLFLDEIKNELELAGKNEAKLNMLWEKLGNIKLLDPACGCGNFLVIAYRELRRIELEIIKRKYASKEDLPEGIEVANLSRLSVENMFGIEIEKFASEIAKLSLWITDHIANVELGNYFGEFFSKLPLKEQPHIVCANALTLDWETVVPKKDLAYILGNPPFVGSKIMSDEQRKEITGLFGDGAGGGVLDYVSGWYLKAAKYIQDTDIECAFVSTNSITQGEQVGILWDKLIRQYKISVSFAHRTFKWTNEAPGVATVFCVIIGFGLKSKSVLHLYEYEDIKGEPHEILAKHINPYLVDAPDVFIHSRGKPICDVPEIGIGNKPIDGGIYLFTKEEKDKFIEHEPASKNLFRRWIGSDEFLNGWERWCLWLGDTPPDKLRGMPEVLRRIEAVKQFRLLSKSAPTRKLAENPTHFHVENMPKSNYLVMPETSSENRHYIPFGFLTPNIIVSNAMKIMPDATLYHFGVLESEMHMAWTKAVCGRLESRYRYSKDIVYNNFPWPENATEEQKGKVEEVAQEILDARKQFPDSTLADLYDPNTMPKVLLDAHHKLDRAVDACYGKKSFESEATRLEFLFGKYKDLIDNTK